MTKTYKLSESYHFVPVEVKRIYDGERVLGYVLSDAVEERKVCACGSHLNFLTRRSDTTIWAVCSVCMAATEIRSDDRTLEIYDLLGWNFEVTFIEEEGFNGKR